MQERNTVVVPYDAAWPRQFEAERAVLESVLAPWLLEGVHHVGSTSVPGLAAKPIIDMIAGVHALERARAAFAPLRELGYEYREHRPEAHLFWKPAPETAAGATHSLHLTEPGSDLWRERLAFRDALRADPGLAAEYEQLKLRLIDEGSYSAPAKRTFIARVLAQAGIELQPDRERLTPAARAERERATATRSV